MTIRIVYLGSPDFAVPPLLALHQSGANLVAVVTQPDRRRDRGRLTPTPVKAKALELGLTLLTPDKINAPDSVAAIRALRPDLLVVAAYGQILRQELLNIPTLGAINIHGSLLPALRGAAPIQRAILNGEQQSGVTIIYLDQGMDSGDIISSAVIPIPLDMTGGQLFDAICTKGSELLLDAVRQIVVGCAPRWPQDHQRATYAPMLTKADEVIDWSRDNLALHNQVRGLNPSPGAYTLWQGKRLKLWRSYPDQMAAPADARPGQVLAVGKSQFWVQCGQGSLRLEGVQPEGRGLMDGGAFARGSRLQAGDILG